MSATPLLEQSQFPDTPVLSLAVSGGADSVGMALLALELGREVEIHHVDHHARADSGDDRAFVEEWGRRHGVIVHSYDVVVPPGPNFEARARAERRRVLPTGVLTGHTADDIAETFLLNLIRGAATPGLGVGDVATMPLRGCRRRDLREWLSSRDEEWREDPSNLSPAMRRNRVRGDVITLLSDVAGRDVVPLLLRSVEQLSLDRAYLDEVSREDCARGLEEVDCRELAQWSPQRRHVWLRHHLRWSDELGESHPPSRAEIRRADDVVLGLVRACELLGGRRLSRHQQHLSLS